eukprot:TRINITY_DN94835_c0_g1_i1.p1 TRINITY_DN94835_c0_g1~~TRINITY_DN94835_c0_g1_i1.p1  ORF type:complete len:342 (+),score=86.93 TRINITY_DN94835_c0_g1_i1:137-1162(+)
MSVVAAPSRELHLPRPRDGPVTDIRALKRANRLAGVADAVGSMDLKAVADTYQREAGSSGIEAAAVAAAALGAALKASLAGGAVDGSECARVAQQEVRKAASKKAREAKGEAVRAARAAEDGHEGQARAEALRVSQEARSNKAVAEKGERLADDAATKRAMREERMAAAASRRCLSEARARFGHHSRPRLEGSDSGDSLHVSAPNVLADDPVVRRAKALCTGAAQVVAQLDAQNQLLRGKPQAPARPPEPKAVKAAPGAAEDEALIARAKELLADYKPEQRRPPVPSAANRAASARASAPSSNASSNHGSPKGELSALQRARQQCADVCIEMTEKKSGMRR